MIFEETVHYRRSVRRYVATLLDIEKVKHCLSLSALAPNSSNMQLYEFYHITDPQILKKIAIACLGQQTAITAQQMVVFVTRQDLYRLRAKKMFALESQNIIKTSPEAKQDKRI